MLRRVGLARPASWMRPRPGLAAVLVVAVAVRAALLPLTSGQDFRVWDLASAATLHGSNIYAHHPRYPGGPYAYFPFFVWLELPFQWLAQHTGLTFVVLGKLPIAAADLALGVLLRSELLRRGCTPTQATIGMAAVLLNPLILYNGAFYGRFDSIAVLLLFAAVSAARSEHPVSWRATWVYALAVAAKTFPIVAVVAFARRGVARITVAVLVTLAALLIPYHASLPAVIHDLVLYDAGKTPQALSWQQLLPYRSHPFAASLTSLIVVVGCAAVLVVAAIGPMGRELPRYTLAAVLLFILADRVVLEQYLTWPLPFLAVAALAGDAERGPSWALYAVLTAIGMLVNPYLHPFGPAPVWLAVFLAIAITGYLLVTVLIRPRAAEAAAGLRSSGALARRCGDAAARIGRTPDGRLRRRIG